MKRLIIFIFISLLISLKPSKVNLDKTNNDLFPYIIEFSKNTNNYISLEEINKYLDFEYDTLGYTSNVLEEKGTIGQCMIPFFETKGKITIDPNYWEKASEYSKKGLILHEMAHCACSVGHTVEIYELETHWLIKFLHKFGIKTARDRVHYRDDGCAKSIMFPYIPSNYCIEKHWNEYVEEVNKKCRPWSLTSDNIFNRPKK
jgi:hypothetical protein